MTLQLKIVDSVQWDLQETQSNANLFTMVEK